MNIKKELSLAEINRLKTTEKVKKALDKMKMGKVSITITNVCKMATITRKTIYNRPDLKTLIEEYSSLQADLNGSNKTENKPKEKGQGEQIKRLREKNKALIEEKKKILEQNMLLLKKMTDLEHKIFDLEEKLYTQSELKVVSINK